MRYNQIIVFFFVWLSFSSCVDDQVEPQIEYPQLVKIGEKIQDGLKISVYSDHDRFFEGFNVIYVALEDGETPILGYSNEVKLSSTMDLPIGRIGNPVVQPQYDQTTGLYVGAVIFTRPSNQIDPWELKVEFNGRSFDINLLVQSLPLTSKYTSEYLGTEGKVYRLTLVDPMAPKVGFNDLLILVHEKIDQQTFIEKDGLEIELETEIITSGQVSSGHDHPLNTGAGFYVGKVSLSTPGEWQLSFKLMEGENVILENGFLNLKF